MIKTIIILWAFFSFSISSAQNTNLKTIYIVDNKAIINPDIEGLFHYLISIKSKDDRFNYDAYKFIIPNRVGYNSYKNLKKIEKIIPEKEIKKIELNTLKKMKPYKLHEFLSLQDKIFLICKNKAYNIIYKGTQKNLETLHN